MQDRQYQTDCIECGERKAHAKNLCGKCYQRKFRKDNPDWDSIVWNRMKKDGRKELLKAAKKRAKQRGRSFDIRLEDIVIPDVCPILGLKLEVGKNLPTEFSPSLDEIVVGKGYVIGNIQIVSRKANTMKSNASPEELIKFAEWIKKTYEG